MNTRRSQLEEIYNAYFVEITESAVKYMVSQALILAIIYQESGGSSTAHRYEPAVSQWPTVRAMAGGDAKRLLDLATSWGLMQVMGYHRPDLTPGQLERPATNINEGTRILVSQPGDWNDRIAAYNGGSGAVDAFKKTGVYPNRQYVSDVNALWLEAREVTAAKVVAPTVSDNGHDTPQPPKTDAGGGTLMGLIANQLIRQVVAQVVGYVVAHFSGQAQVFGVSLGVAIHAAEEALAKKYNLPWLA